MHASMNHAMPRPRRRIASRYMAAALGLAALLLGAGQASAQSNYQITWQECFDRDSSTDTDVYGTVAFTVPTTGESFTASLRVTDNTTSSALSFDYYAADGSAVATIDVSAAESVVRTTSYGQKVSSDAAIAFVQILQDPDFQTPLRGCMAVCQPSHQALFNPMCLLSKTLCCGIVTDTCAPCDFASASCYETFHDPC